LVIEERFTEEKEEEIGNLSEHLSGEEYLLALGHERGHVTYEDIQRAFPEAEEDISQLDSTIATLLESGITVGGPGEKPPVGLAAAIETLTDGETVKAEVALDNPPETGNVTAELYDGLDRLLGETLAELEDLFPVVLRGLVLEGAKGPPRRGRQLVEGRKQGAARSLDLPRYPVRVRVQVLGEESVP